jgi:mRNA-degrading endonuclease RelE of RelBE toxin-antitoxin system
MPPPVIVAKKAVASLDKLPDTERAAVVAALQLLPRQFGRPHLHSGLGIRRLRHEVFEFRASQALRGLFLWRQGEIRVECIGDHDEIRRYLRAHA